MRRSTAQSHSACAKPDGCRKEMEFRSRSQKKIIVLLVLVCDAGRTSSRFKNSQLFLFLFRSWTAEMLRARAHADEASGDLAQNWKPFRQTEDEWERSLCLTGGSTSNDSTMNKDLHSLNQAGRPFTARLYFSQIVDVNRTALQLFREQVGRRYCILNRKVDSDTARR